MHNDGRILTPRVHESVFVAEGARIYGDVEIGAGTSIWFNAVIRGAGGGLFNGEDCRLSRKVRYAVFI